jgi:N-methylhydantoinase B/oxoprolinase/acetone carboxylase alpha subunit
MQNCVRYLHDVNLGKLRPGDVLVSNHPGMCIYICIIGLI